jgi:hypothetical protein
MPLARGKSVQLRKKERAMRNRTGLLILVIVVLALLATGGSVSAMALTHSGFTGNGYGMMNSQQGYQGMLGGQYNHGSMMGGYLQSPVQQETPVSGSTTHLTMDIVYLPHRSTGDLHLPLP